MLTNLKYALCALVLLCTTTTFAQNSTNYYWSDGQQIPIKTDRTSLILQFQDGYEVADYLQTQNAYLEDYEIHAIQGRAVLRFSKDLPGQAADLAKAFVSNATVLRSASFGYQLNDGFQIWPTHNLVLQLNKGVTIADLNPHMSEAKASFAKEQFGRILLEVADIENVLPFANQLREQGLAKWAHPDFYAKITHMLTPSDTYFGSQFQMNNSNDVDCDAPEAWDITRGDAGIRVAVIDDGVETHPDLPNLNTALGYSPANNGNGTPNSSGAHGVACAGIINAAHNGAGVAGAAPNVEIFSVNIFLGGETGNDLANAISYSKNNGADILSNSWGYGSCTYSLSALNTAMADAKNNGRNGKGSVIVFASGNDYQSCVSYPGNNDNVIAVGAITNTGVRSSYSNQGPKLDISAPSNGGTLGVYTTDRTGSAGYASGSYTSTFGGTSAACPLVAGVAALVLSANGNLSSTDVQTILETTATDMGSSGFDVQFGHGRVDADDAIIAAQAGSGGGGGNGGGSGGGSCADANLTLSLTTDNYGSETSWNLTDANGNVVESGSGYANNTSYTFNWTLADGQYTFTINDSYGDGICCSYGNGSYDLADANGNIVASGGSFGSAEATDFCTESASGGGGGSTDPCLDIDLSAEIINSYGGTQDAGTHSISGTTLIISGNAWKYIDLNYEVTASTVIEFDFGSTNEGEIHGIGFDSDNGISSNRTFRVYGSQNWGLGNYNDYTASAGNWKSYTIPVGQFYTGTFDRLFFVCDDDAGNAGNSQFRNIKIYEGSCGAAANLTTYADVTNIIHAAEGEHATDLRLYPTPSTNVLNVQLNVNDAVQTRVTDALGRVVSSQMMQGGINQLNVADFPAGMYQLTIIQSNGDMITEKFMKVD